MTGPREGQASGRVSLAPEPEVAAEERVTAKLSVRYEDIAQDGRLMLEAIPQALGAVVWSKVNAGHPIGAARAAGIVPVLARLTMEGFGGPIAVGRSLRAEGFWRLAHTVDELDAPNRILLDMWASVHGIAGRTHGRQPDNAGEPLQLGRVFARHVFSRMFAPPGQRKILRLDVPGLEPLPADRERWLPAEMLLQLPDGAVALEAEPTPDPAVITFGVCHTDSNQHVNSLVYPRLFEEALLRRLAALGRAEPMLSRFVDIGYRKPCFAGDRARIVLGAFELDDRLGAVGCFVPDAPGARPSAFVTMLLSR